MDHFGAATDMNLRKELEEKLLTEHKVWMWSYDVGARMEPKNATCFRWRSGTG